MKLIFVLVILMVRGSGQGAVVKGELVDSIGKKSSAHAVVALLRQSDSTLVRFTRVAADGRFTFAGVVTGDFLLFVSHPGFAEQWVSVKVASDTNMELGKIILSPQSGMLAAAIVAVRRPVLRLKGDTVEYDATAIKTRINASVEDLLKQLPGVEVDQKGGITAQGQKIQKILIDGEEFFSNDPIIATRNLNASMVDKVQVLNRKGLPVGGFYRDR